MHGCLRDDCKTAQHSQWSKGKSTKTKCFPAQSFILLFYVSVVSDVTISFIIFLLFKNSQENCHLVTTGNQGLLNLNKSSAKYVLRAEVCSSDTVERTPFSKEGAEATGSMRPALRVPVGLCRAVWVHTFASWVTVGPLARGEQRGIVWLTTTRSIQHPQQSLFSLRKDLSSVPCIWRNLSWVITDNFSSAVSYLAVLHSSVFKSITRMTNTTICIMLHKFGSENN